MKKLVATVAALAFLAGPAYAQMGKPSAGNDDHRAQQAAKAAKERAGIEKDYDETMARLKTQAAPPKADPWGKLRPANGADAKR